MGGTAASVSPLVQARGALEDCAVSVRMRDLLMGELERCASSQRRNRIRGTAAGFRTADPVLAGM
jgi:hypothetical protein